MKRCVLALVLVALLSGCTALRLAYRQADVLISWRVNQYFDLEAGQKQDFNARLTRILAWHRYEQLPDYAAFMTTALEKVKPGLKRDDANWIFEGWKSRYKIVAERGANDAADVLASLNAAQIANLQQQWNKDNKKFTREHELEGSVDERKKARLKRALSQIEDWAGSLSNEQEQKIGALLEPIPNIDHLRMKDRLRLQREFLELLKLRTNKAEFQPKLRAWLLDFERGRDPEYDRQAHVVYEHRLQFYVNVDKLLTQAQRQNVVEKVQRFIDDFRNLSQKS
jgi:hemerythrin superfamily protein